MAGALSVGTQADLIGPILKLTMPNGVGPFVEKLAKLGAVLGADVPLPAAPATKSRKPSMNSSAPAASPGTRRLTL